MKRVGAREQKRWCYSSKGSDESDSKNDCSTNRPEIRFCSRLRKPFRCYYLSRISLFCFVAGLVFFERPVFIRTSFVRAAPSVDEKSLSDAASGVSVVRHSQKASAATVEREKQEEGEEKVVEETLSPRTVRIAIIGGGISGAAAATFLSLLEKQLRYERRAKPQNDKRDRSRKSSQGEEESSTKDEREGRETSSEIEGDEATDEEESSEERWWMNRPIKFQLDVYEASARYGGRMEYGDIAGRIVELGDVDVNASNFLMTVFHDLLNEFADVLGGAGWTTPGDGAAAAAGAHAAADTSPTTTDTQAETDDTSATAAGHHETAEIAWEAAAAAANQAASAPQAVAATANGAVAQADEALATASQVAAIASAASATGDVAVAELEESDTAANKEVTATDERSVASEDEAVSHHITAADTLPLDESPMEGERNAVSSNQQQILVDTQDGKKQRKEKEMKQEMQQSQNLPSLLNDGGNAKAEPSVKEHNDGDMYPQAREKEPKSNFDSGVEFYEESTATGPEPNAGVLMPKTNAVPPNLNFYTKGWKQPFTFPVPLTEFQGISPGPTVLLHDFKRVTPIVSLTLALIKSGATVLSEPLKHIILRWQRIYDYTFGGFMCAKRAAISLFPGRGHYIAPHPSRQLSDGRPFCSVIEQARSAANTGVDLAEALKLGKEIKQPFSALVKSYPIERVGLHLIDSLIRGVYSQRAKHLHTLAGALGVAGTFEAPYDRKRYSGRVLAEFLIARAADNSFLRCPIAKVIELEDEIVYTYEASHSKNTAHPPRKVSVGSKAAFDSVSKVRKGSAARVREKLVKSFKSAFSSSGDRIVTKRRKRYKIEPASNEGHSNPHARRHLENTVYDFVIITAPLEDSSLTLYRRDPAQRKRGAVKAQTTTAAARSSVEGGAPKKVTSKERRKGMFVDLWDGEATQLHSMAESTDDAENIDLVKTKDAVTASLKIEAHVQSGQTEAVENSTHESGTHRTGGKYRGKYKEGYREESHWKLKEVIVPERPYVTAQTTCAAADGLVNYRTHGDGLSTIKNRSEWSNRVAPTTVLTSDSLSDEYFSFGEFFMATCHSVVDSELNTPYSGIPSIDEGKSSLLVFFTPEEGNRLRREKPIDNAEIFDGESTHRIIQTTTKQEENVFSSGEWTRSDGASGESAVQNWKLNAKIALQLNSARLERQEREEEGSSGAKTLYYRGTPVSSLWADGLFSRIKSSTSLSRHLGQTICCAVTADELDDRDVTDVFKNVSHLDRRGWDFARPKMYPIRDKKKRRRPAGKRIAQTYIWGEKEEAPPPTVRREVTNFILMENVYYSSAFENVVSFSEGAVIAAKNVANLVVKQILENYDD